MQIDALKDARAALLEGESAPRAAVRRLAHRLHGSGGTYGFHELSERAAELEHAADEDLVTRLDALLAELRRVTSAPDDGGRRRVLVVEPEPGSRAVLEEAAATWADDVDAVGSLREATASLAAKPASLVVLSLVLADGDGRQFLAEMRADPTLADVPVIVVGDAVGPQARTECLALGALEVFERPLDRAEVGRAMSALLGVTARPPELVDGLLPRRGFLDAVRAARDAYDMERPWTVALVQVHGVDDAAVDDVIRRAAAEALVAHLPPPARVARWEADVFAVLQPRTTGEEATARLEAFLRFLEHEALPTGDGGALRVRATAGGAEAGLEGVGQAMAVARRMLTLAYFAGGGRVVVAGITAAGRHRVLLAEDDEDMAALTRATLEEEGLQVVHRTDGAAALALAREHRFDAVVLDVVMPGLDGVTVLQRLREDARYDRVPIVLLTSLGDERHMVLAFERGADDYVVKPYRPAVLGARIRNLLGKGVHAR